jgi:hypothetical protein
MSKTSETRLTASRKKGRRPSRSRRPFRLDVDILDGLLDCCQNITTLARLLNACDYHPEAEPLESTLVHNAGHLIVREAEQLRGWLDELGKAAR